MDRIVAFRDTIERVLLDYARLPYAYGDIRRVTVFDRDSDHYLLLSDGWNDDRRIHGTLVHIDIIDGKIWVQRDGTEYGIANELVDAGIPRTDIVLGFQPPEIRPFTDFAAA